MSAESAKSDPKRDALSTSSRSPGNFVAVDDFTSYGRREGTQTGSTNLEADGMNHRSTWPCIDDEEKAH